MPEHISRRDYFAAAALTGLCARITEARFVELRDGIQGGRHEARVAMMLAHKLLTTAEPEPDPAPEPLNTRLVAMLKRLEWAGTDTTSSSFHNVEHSCCPECRIYRGDGAPPVHEYHCSLGALLREIEAGKPDASGGGEA